MRNRGELILGGALVVMGLVFLIGALFNINVWALCWPVGLILVGAWLVLGPRLAGPDSNAEVLLLGDKRRRGNWTVKDEEIWLGVGDVELDFSQAVIPSGETTLRILTFVGDVDMYVPASVGVDVRVVGFVVDADLLGRDYDSFLTPVEVRSENYATAECRVRIEMTGFVTDLKVKHL